jgi:hypothetical protein
MSILEVPTTPPALADNPGDITSDLLQLARVSVPAAAMDAAR